MHLLVKFNFSRDHIDAVQASQLSGGERAKVILASIAAQKANLLILDEPTNNLDIPTIEGLQEALSSYKGAIVLVSHDREFIESIGIARTINLAN
jgi:ATP-binding cassette subfamily F protein uup